MHKDTKVLLPVMFGLLALVVGLMRLTDMTPDGKLTAVGLYVGAYLSVLLWSVGRMHEEQSRWAKLLPNVGRAAFKRELYPAMRYALDSATDAVYVTYFGDRAPGESGNRAEDEYHSALTDRIRHSTVAVRRIIALDSYIDTDRKRRWVDGEMSLMRQCPDHYSVRFIVAPGWLPLNVQGFDSSVFIIDPCRTNVDAQPRDIQLLSEEVATIWSRYFDVIWDRCVDALPPGTFRQPGRRRDGKRKYT